MPTKCRLCVIIPLALSISCLLLTACVSLPPNATPTPTISAISTPTSTPTVEASAPGPTNTPVHAAGDLHLAVHEDIKTLNPYLVSNASEEFITSLLYDTLLDGDLAEDLKPNLAERWELASDGTSLIFWLNPRARWHNGRPVTAKDVVFSFNLVRQQFPGLARVVAPVDRAEAVTTREVKFVLLDARVDIVRLLGTQLRIVPADIWSELDDPLHYTGLDNPVGSGPFSLQERGDDGRFILRNTNAHHCINPGVNRLVIEILHDEGSALQALKSGKLDALGWDVAPHIASDVRDNPDDYAGIKLVETSGIRTWALLLNLRKAPYDNRLFRQALAQAIDVKAIIDAVLAGFADAATPGLFAPASPWRNPSITPLAYDPQQASEKLDAAGFLDRDGDGLREAPDGNVLQIPISCPDLPASLRVTELVAADWQSIGIQAIVQPLAQDQVLPTLMQAQFDVMLYSISLSEPETAFFHFHTSCGRIRGGRVFGLNYGGYANPEYDELVEASREERDPAKLRELVYRLQEILATDLPQIPLYTPQVLNLCREDRFGGWSAQPGIGLLNRTVISKLYVLTPDL